MTFVKTGVCAMDFQCLNVAVVAGSNLPRGTTYGPLTEFEFPPKWISDRVTEENSELIQVNAQNGKLVSGNPLIPWLQYLRASRDIYEQNIEAVLSHDNTVYIRVTRNVAQGELLCGWYDERYAREINVPYLTLQNIRGVQDYRCHVCDRKFGFPNILKAHLMYNCPGSESRDQRIKRIKSHNLQQKMTKLGEESLNSFFEKRKSQKIPPLSENRVILPDLRNSRKSHNEMNRPELKCQYFASINCQLSYEINRHAQFDICRLDTGLGGLTPESGLIHKQGHVTTMKENSPKQNVDPYIELKQSINPSPGNNVEPLDIIHKSFIELSTKRGHLCIYCGKFYSRKYGLKIHLRTHTGYKPLKCKICSRAFGDPSNLNKHIRLHAEGSTPYRCHHCGKLLVRRRDLVRHLNSRHPDKNTEHT